MEAFFKAENGELLTAPNIVVSPDFVLRIELQETYTYPMDGWYYFVSEEEAYKFFGLVPELTGVENEIELQKIIDFLGLTGCNVNTGT